MKVFLPFEAIVLVSMTEYYKAIRRRDDWDENHYEASNIIQSFKAAGNPSPPYKLLATSSVIAADFFEQRKIDLETLKQNKLDIAQACKELFEYKDLLDPDPVDPREIEPGYDSKIGFRNFDLKVFDAANILLNWIEGYLDEEGNSIVPQEQHDFMKRLIRVKASFMEDMSIILPTIK